MAKQILVTLMLVSAFFVYEQTAQAQNSDAQKSNANQIKKKKKAPAKFQWVSPRPKSTPEYLLHKSFKSDANKTDVGYVIYLPQEYEASKQKKTRYPVVYLLHGGRPGGEWKMASLMPQIHQTMSQGKIPPTIYVLVNGGKLSHYDHECYLGEQAFLELIEHIDSTYRTIADRSGRAVEGFSQGGRGTGRYMFKHHKLFCSAAPLGGGHQHELRISENDGWENDGLRMIPPTNNTWDLMREYAKHVDPDLHILVAVGDQDFNYEANLAWHDKMESLGIAHQMIVVPGIEHSARKMYEKRGLEIMQFHQQNFGR